jgi:hypothetical protein
MKHVRICGHSLDGVDDERVCAAASVAGMASYGQWQAVKNGV